MSGLKSFLLLPREATSSRPDDHAEVDGLLGWFQEQLRLGSIAVRRYGSTEVIRHAKDANAVQRNRCRACAYRSLDQTLPLADVDEVLELDELWSFVGSRARVRWLWVALGRRTRQVVASVLGDRSEETQHEPVGKGSGQTHHVERWDLTLRQRLGRFVRKTLSFSKSERRHEICLRIFLHDYNTARCLPG